MISLSRADEKASSSSEDARSRKRFKGAAYSFCITIYDRQDIEISNWKRASTGRGGKIRLIGELRTC